MRCCEAKSITKILYPKCLPKLFMNGLVFKGNGRYATSLPFESNGISPYHGTAQSPTSPVSDVFSARTPPTFSALAAMGVDLPFSLPRENCVAEFWQPNT